MLGLVAGGAEAAPRNGANPAAQAVAQQALQPDLSSKYGKTKSRVNGEFGKAGSVNGTFTPRRFKVRDGQLIAVGKLRATLVRGNGNTVGSVVERIEIPVRKANGGPARLAAAPASCDILNLVLGPLDLNLLGFEVHLKPGGARHHRNTGPGEPSREICSVRWRASWTGPAS